MVSIISVTSTVLFRNTTYIKLSAPQVAQIDELQKPLRHSLNPAVKSALFEDAVSGLYPSPPCKSSGVGLCCCYSSFEDHNKANGLSCKRSQGPSLALRPLSQLKHLCVCFSLQLALIHLHPPFSSSPESSLESVMKPLALPAWGEKALKPPLVMFANFPPPLHLPQEKLGTQVHSSFFFFFIPSSLLGFFTYNKA